MGGRAKFIIAAASVMFLLIVLPTSKSVVDAQEQKAPAFLEPKPLVPGAEVVTLWPAGSPMLKTLKGYDEPELLEWAEDMGFTGAKGKVQ